MPTNRQVVLMKSGPDEGTLLPLGSLDEVRRQLGAFNTAGDGDSRADETGMATLHGPGMVVEIPLGVDPVTQAMVTLVEEDIAWPVLMRLCQTTRWSMVDLETGRTFG
ncbi:MAG: hypothetical protein IIC49_05990 [Planctomycetes bacterium]|nr:hypothetical protein [Planctomycetota bacterium]MCH7961868.1 hypothetical protein [Planctomycetota bacterium]MCH9001387.1 hypothetical protein [Planctomycetota bacterium]